MSPCDFDVHSRPIEKWKATTCILAIALIISLGLNLREIILSDHCSKYHHYLSLYNTEKVVIDSLIVEGQKPHRSVDRNRIIRLQEKASLCFEKAVRFRELCKQSTGEDPGNQTLTPQ